MTDVRKYDYYIMFLKHLAIGFFSLIEFLSLYYKQIVLILQTSV